MPVLGVGVSGGLTGGQQGCRWHWRLHMKNEDSLLQSTVENYKRSIADNRTWGQINGTQLHTTLGHQMPLLGVHLTECQPVPRNHQMSRWPNIVPFWATRCLYWGMSGFRSTGPMSVPSMATRCLYQGDTSDWMSAWPKSHQMSRWPDLVPFLLIRCLYWWGTSHWMSASPKESPNVKMT